MARHTLLSDTLLMVKGELGYALTANVGVAGDQELYTLIDSVQKWLSSEYDWPFLKSEADITVAPNGRYYDIPSTINFERPVRVATLWATYWHPVEFGIGIEEYNALSAGDHGTKLFNLNPIQRWDWRPDDSTGFEIWPIPTQQQFIRFSGQKPLATLKNAGAYDPTKTLDLDDILVTLYTAAKKLSAMKKQNAQAVLAQAESRFNRLRASYSHRTRPVVFGGVEERPQKRVVPIVTVA